MKKSRKHYPALLGLFLLLYPCHTLLQAQRPVKYSPAPNIALPSLVGDTLRLAPLKGKVVLVDFWASWCASCRVLNRSMVKLYEQYHPAGFEIFSVSIDNDPDKWQKAVELDGMPWLQVNQGDSWKAPVLKAWGVYRLPASYLIDKEGIIISVDPSYGVLARWLEELFPARL